MNLETPFHFLICDIEKILMKLEGKEQRKAEGQEKNDVCYEY